MVHLLVFADCSDKYPTPDVLRAMTKQGETAVVPYAGVRRHDAFPFLPEGQVVTSAALFGAYEEIVHDEERFVSRARFGERDLAAVLSLRPDVNPPGSRE